MIDIKLHIAMNQKTTPAVQIHVEAQLGNPQAECKGFGIRTLDEMNTETWEIYRPNNIRRAKALLWFENGCLRFAFPENGMLIPCRAHFFFSGSFLVQSPFVLPKSICRILGIAAAAIPAGIYPCERDEDVFTITFPVEMEENEAIGANMLWRKAV